MDEYVEERKEVASLLRGGKHESKRVTDALMALAKSKSAMFVKDHCEH